mmetsp:Transcript_55282/g.147562  ORF Transcript_55282/g.147562 Transcript_55282/m.147562 type:complete len:235 (+) Transcript_55282:2083-2787(+)
MQRRQSEKVHGVAAQHLGTAVLGDVGKGAKELPDVLFTQGEGVVRTEHDVVLPHGVDHQSECSRVEDGRIHRETTLLDVVAGGVLRLAPGNLAFVPRVVHATEQERERPASVCEAQLQTAISGQLVEGTTEQHAGDRHVRLHRHAHRPLHHVLFHPPLQRRQVPRMYQDRDAEAGAVVQEGEQPRVVQVLVHHVVAQLHTLVAALECPLHLHTRHVHVLKGDLRQRKDTVLRLA